MNASASFVAKANPLNRAPHKRKSELHHALCNMLSNILAPLADSGKGHWPPSGVEPALNLWYEALARIRMQLHHWMDRQSKHIAVSISKLQHLNILYLPFLSCFWNLMRMFECNLKVEKNHLDILVHNSNANYMNRFHVDLCRFICLSVVYLVFRDREFI